MIPLPFIIPRKMLNNFIVIIPKVTFFFPSRLTKIKRQELVLNAIAKTHHEVNVIFAGNADDGRYDEQLKEMSEKLGISHRAIFLNRISEKEKLKYYAECLGVIYPPLDEDYGYVTLEGMLSSKPVISCSDSGGPLEFLIHQETGIIAQSTPEALAEAMDQLWDNRNQSLIMGKNARKHYESMNITWSNVIEKLTTI
jgi:glycosyltransferase involved in cell wall biosynthesis